jgi:Protein of unknown function (DUF998)
MREPNVAKDSSRGTVQRVLLACGFVYALGYAVANDVIAAARYEGYSRMSQAVSELSASGAPTQSFLAATVPIFTVLLAAFGIAVWRAARGRRALRLAGGLLVAHALTFPLWLLAPMSLRTQIAAGAGTSSDTMHLVLTAMTILFILGQIASGAAALGTRFRVYSVATAATVLIAGALTGVQSAKLTVGAPTPWLGLTERVSIAAWLLWLAVLSLVLLRETVAASDGVLASRPWRHRSGAFASSTEPSSPR